MSLFSVFRKGLQKTATAISRSISAIFTDVRKWDDNTFAALEQALLEADFGTEAAKKTVDKIKDQLLRNFYKQSREQYSSNFPLRI